MTSEPPNLTPEEIRELEALMPAPDACPHGMLPAYASGRPVNRCTRCFVKAQEKLAERKAAESR